MAETVNFTQQFNGVNAQSAPHTLADGECQSAINIDFSLQRGAATVRRGSKVWKVVGSGKIRALYRHYALPYSIDTAPYYSFDSGGRVFRDSTQIIGAGNGGVEASAAYGQFTYISANSGDNMVKDDGTNTYDWIKPAPEAPTVVITTCAPLTVASSFTTVEGNEVANGTASTTSEPYRVTFSYTGAMDLSQNSGAEVGDYGTDFLSISFSDPSLVTRVSRDYSIGDANFTNFFHTEMDIEVSDPMDALPYITALAESLESEGQTDEVLQDARLDIRPPITRVSAAKDTFNAWGVPRAHFEMVGKYQGTTATSPWSNIQAVRVIVEAVGPQTVAIKDWQVIGNTEHTLSDPNIGYQWWVTYAKVVDGVVVEESAPSSPSARYPCQFSQATLNVGTTPGGSSDVTHYLWYRQGGYLRDAFCVGTTALNIPTLTDTLSDVKVLMEGRRMTRNVYSAIDFPSHTTAIAKHYDRLFLLQQNRLIWSLPGQPDTFPMESVLTVSHAGDEGQALIPYNNSLVVVCRDSVWELMGNNFEPPGANFSLHRSPSPHGSKAKQTIIRTPYGVFLLDYDGVYLYQPGQGQAVPIEWAMEKMRDAFTGTNNDDPAAQKNYRIPAINKSYLFNSCAAFANNRIYLAVPAFINSTPSIVFVLDFATQQVWWYEYYVNITAMMWDQVDNRLIAGTDDGRLMLLEAGLYDTDSSGTIRPIPWLVKTRAWTVPTDTVMENVMVEGEGLNGAVLYAQYDSDIVNTAINTFTGTDKRWVIPPTDGTFVRSVEMKLLGTQTGAIPPPTLYQLGFNALSHPPRVRFYRTDHTTSGVEGEKVWDYHHADLELGHTLSTPQTVVVEGTVFIDNNPITTHTITAFTPSAAGRKIYRQSLPPATYGNVAHTVYRITSSTNHYFKHWDSSYGVRPEPPRVTSWRTDVQSMEEQICDAIDFDIAPFGTVTTTVFVDNTATTTHTTTGEERQSFVWTLSTELYGRTIYALHQSNSPFKHYQTWFHLRPEPDRLTAFVTDRVSGDEKWWKSVETDMNCLWGTVLATHFLDGTVLSTDTLTGSLRQSYVMTLPANAYGRTIWTGYRTLTPTMRFKHYRTWQEGEDEPDRLTLVQSPPVPYPSDQFLKTWVAQLNPLGTCTGTVLVDDSPVFTSTFTGTHRQTFHVGIDLLPSRLLSTARTVRAVYRTTSPGGMKHYGTDFETTAKPFGKKSWSISYRKIGGATQLDMARFFMLDVEAIGTATLTSAWDVDGATVHTTTHTLVNREWIDRQSFPPGVRGELFQQRVWSEENVMVWASTLDLHQVGPKGMSRRQIRGTPE